MKQIYSRSDFPLLCNSLGFVEAVEVGVDQGCFAEEFLSQWDGNTLTCIDPWEPYPEMNYDRTPDMLSAVVRLSKFGWHAKIIRARSPEAIALINPARRIDFVYIDGAHDYQSVRNDVLGWYDRLTPGGILAGHDFCDEHKTVVDVVTRFTETRNLQLFVTSHCKFNPSWYFQKPRHIPDSLGEQQSPEQQQ